MNLHKRCNTDRLLRLVVATLFLIWLPVGAFFASLNLSTPNRVLVIGPTVPVIVGLVWAWIRVWRTGITVVDDRLVVRSCWRTRTYSRGVISRASGVPDEGWFYVVFWPVVSGAWQSGVVQLETRDGVVSLGASLTSLKCARVQAEGINRWLGLDIGAGVGPRRTRK